jgi:hypothetical protein
MLEFFKSRVPRFFKDDILGITCVKHTRCDYSSGYIMFPKLDKREGVNSHRHAADELLHCTVFALYLGCQQGGDHYLKGTQSPQRN